MKINCYIASVVWFLVLATTSGWTQTNSPDSGAASPSEIRPPEPELRNKVGLSYRMGLNITVDFKKLGGYPSVGNPGPATGSAVDRTYDNGSYNKVDISGNAGGQTASDQPAQGRPHSLVLSLPPLAAVYLKWVQTS